MQQKLHQRDGLQQGDKMELRSTLIKNGQRSKMQYMEYMNRQNREEKRASRNILKKNMKKIK